MVSVMTCKFRVTWTFQTSLPEIVAASATTAEVMGEWHYDSGTGVREQHNFLEFPWVFDVLIESFKHMCLTKSSWLW